MKIKKVRRNTHILIPLSLSLVTLGLTFLHLPYRQTEGIIKATGKNMPNHALLHNSERLLLDYDFSNSQEWTKYELLYSG